MIARIDAIKSCLWLTFSGEKVTEPHDVRCDCEKCLVYNKEDSLRHSRSRINAYKALSSPCYISLSSRDPIMTAFDLNRELKRLSRIENEFKQEYEQLAQQCQEYSAALLAETRSSKELEIILNYDADNPPAISETTTEKMHLSRLKLAIRYKQKKVSARAREELVRTSPLSLLVVRVAFTLSAAAGFVVVRRPSWISTSTFSDQDPHHDTRRPALSRAVRRLSRHATK